MPRLGRNEISWDERVRRYAYFFLRDELDGLLIQEALIESYRAFKAAGKEYPFVSMRELKPRAKMSAPEYQEQGHFIVIFVEDMLPPQTKKDIRFFDSNKITKENLGHIAEFDLRDLFHQRMRFFDDKDFSCLLKSLLQADYALLIQRDPTVKARNRYALSHFHVRIDWPVADAAQDLAQDLRYISRDLYEKGERTAEVLQQRLYEYYGFYHMVGGRRTAALVASRYLSQFDFLSTVYVSSSEARTLFRLSEAGVSKYVLTQVNAQDIAHLSQAAEMNEQDFISAYLIDYTPDYGVGLFLVTYTSNEHSLPPPDGKLRDLSPDYPWLKVDSQLLFPPPTSRDVRPIPYSIVYA